MTQIAYLYISKNTRLYNDKVRKALTAAGIKFMEVSEGPTGKSIMVQNDMATKGYRAVLSVKFK